MAPPIAVAIPMFFLYTHAHLEDTLEGLTIAEVTTVVGIVTWIMIEAFRGIPMELTEAAEVDGPGLVGAATIAFLLTWNEFLLALILTDTRAQTAPLALYQYIGYETFNLSQLAAASCIVLVPTVLVVAMFQKQLITGLTFGAVRG
jgi:multiple sugar transport system permease protein